MRAAFDPLIAATYPIPKSSILPLALLIFGLGEGSKIFMVAIGVFFPVVINATTGVLEINQIYLDVGRNYKASRWNMFWTIALPGALPVIMTGFKLGIGIGLILIAVAEMIGAKSGLGYMIWSAWETFSVEQMYVGLFMIAHDRLRAHHRCSTRSSASSFRGNAIEPCRFSLLAQALLDWRSRGGWRSRAMT